MRRPTRALITALTIGALVTGCTTAEPAERQRQVAERGTEVMPFDLERTTHTFTKRDSGGVQTVTADDPRDAQQISLIREHLREEAAAFSAGDFDDPARIHGDQMPGLAALRAGYEKIESKYLPLPDGARIVYTTSDKALVSALHQWFDAQVGDHGEHAEHG